VAPLVCIENVDFAYGEQLVLKQVSLSIDPKQTVGLIGPNGGGKTTLLRLLLGIYQPTRGHIRIAGLSPIEARNKGDIVGYLPQNYEIPAHFPATVRQVAQMGLIAKTGLLRRYPAEDVAFVDHLLQRVGIRDLAGRAVGSLSGGQRQRLFIVRALAARPQLLLLDEPTTGIDRSGQQRFIEFLQSLREELGLTVILVSHDLRAVSSISDTIACLNVRLHCHAQPQHLPPDVIYDMFACDLQALGLENPPGHVHIHPKP
jgi:zinc transport system ATP-binding protein